MRRRIVRISGSVVFKRLVDDFHQEGSCVVVYARIVGWVRTAREQYLTKSYGVALVLSNMEQFSHHGGENEKIREIFPFLCP
jgi:hypothetical protein